MLDYLDTIVCLTDDLRRLKPDYDSFTSEKLHQERGAVKVRIIRGDGVAKW